MMHLVEAYGTCDEANSMIGLAMSYIQNEFFDEKEEVLQAFHKYKLHFSMSAQN